MAPNCPTDRLGFTAAPAQRLLDPLPPKSMLLTSLCPSPRVRLIPSAALLVALTAAVAPSADASSIAFIQDGNVKLASPDGATIVPVTGGGGFSAVSQADDGTLIALRGQQLVRLDRWGSELAAFAPVASGTAGSITLSGPFDPTISPDGSRVAYGFYVQYKSGDPNCGRPGGCQVGQLYTGTGYARADGPVDWNEAGFHPQWSWTDPSWIDNQRTLLSGATSALVTSSAIDIAGDPSAATAWFSDGAVGNLFDGELNRQGTAAAFVGNTQGDRLLVYRLGAAPPAAPQGCLDAPSQGAAWSSPSWSPSGEQLAWAGKDGIYVADLPGIGAACPNAGSVQVRAFAPGATSPDWGPAGLPGPKPAGAGAGTPQAGGAPTQAPATDAGGTGGGVAPDSQRKLRVSAVTRRAALRNGLSVQVSCTSGRVRVMATLKRRVVGQAEGRCRNGQAKVRVRFSKRGRAAVLASSKPRLTITANGAGRTSITLR